MFKKNNDKDKVILRDTVPPVTSKEKAQAKGSDDSEKARPANARSVSYIGPDLHFSGVIKANEGLVVEGSFEGKLFQEDKPLTVGKKGRVNGLIQASEIDVRGRIDGDIYATVCVRLHAGCEVTGNIYCKSISTEEGATFNGTVNMSQEEIKPEASSLELAASNEDAVAQKLA